jgi:hypothetical protein
MSFLSDFISPLSFCSWFYFGFLIPPFDGDGLLVVGFVLVKITFLLMVMVL